MIGSMGWLPPEAQDLFREFAKYDAEKRRRDRLQVSTALQQIPATLETVNQLCTLSPEDAEHALRQHPGYSMHRRIESLHSMLAIFRRALADLAKAIAEFPELGTPDNRILREQFEQHISVRVNKELFAALGAAKTLVDYSRRIKDMVPTELFESKRNEAFDDGQQALVMNLRNVVLHQVHSEANWRKVFHGGTSTTHFVIRREDLLADGELSRAAQEHLNHLGSTCDVTELLSGYSASVEKFYSWLLPELDSHLPPVVKDYRACYRAVKTHHGRSSYRLLLGLWMQSGVDPYEHLSKHLSSEHLQTVKMLPHRSPEQVDYIISCVDRDGLCDAQLREIIYRFFKVSE
jgi:hypothetical protein